MPRALISFPSEDDDSGMRSPPAPSTPDCLPGGLTVCSWVRWLSVFGGLVLSLSNLAFWLSEPVRSFAESQGWMVVRINTAISVFVAALSLACWGSGPGGGWLKRLAQLGGAFVAVIGGLTSFQYFSGIDLGIDLWFGPATLPGDLGNAFVVHPGRMSLNASGSLFFVGLALLLLETKIPLPRQQSIHVAPVLAILASLPSALGLVGYFLDAGGFTGVLRSTNILLHAAIALYLLALGILAARPDRAPVCYILSRGADGALLRWLLPGSAFLLFVLAWSITQAHLGGVAAPGEGAALMLYGGLVLLTVLIFIGSRVVAREEASARRADAALREEERRSRAILETSLDGVLLMDMDGLVVGWNGAAERIFGWKRHEVLGRPLLEFIIPERLREAHMKGMTRYLQTGHASILGRQLELPALRRDGSEFPVELSINPLLSSDRSVFVGFVRDITRRKNFEQALREGEQRFRALADNISQLAWEADETGKVTWFNRRWSEFTGVKVEETQSTDWPEMVHPDHRKRVMTKLRSCIDRVDAWEDLFPMRGATSDYRWFLARAQPIRDEAGKVERWFGTYTDVTKQRELSDALTKAKELAEAGSRAKDDFLAALSHELRTPLTPVLLSAASLRQDSRLPEDARSALGMMERNIALEGRLIDDLLDLTRITRGKLQIRPEDCDVHALLGHALEIVRDEALRKNIVFHLDLGARLCGVSGDPSRLQQAFWNLLKNAVKFTPEGGAVKVRTRNEGSANNGARWILEVRDTGVGFDPGAAERIFQPFEQGGRENDHRFGGLGLGLAIARAVVDLHGGHIRASSPGPALGATFTVDLPHAHESTAAPQMRAESTRPPIERAPLRILLVEDHEPTLAVLSRLLKKAGHEVITADKVSAALTVSREERFDVLVSDLGLPDGTGIELMVKLRAAQPGLRGIALSGYGMEDDFARTREAGFANHLVKPVVFEQLTQALDELRPVA